MRTYIPSLLILLVCSLGLSHSVQAQKGTVIAKVMDFESTDGKLALTLYNKEKGFPEELEYAVETRILDLNGRDVMVVRWDNLPYGDYALAGHHDANSNGEMDYNWVGIPKEGYCFSNDVKPVLSAPDFSDAKFRLGQEKLTLYIHMQN